MNKISQKMLDIANKLQSEGLSQRAKQFSILAEDFEEQTKRIPKITTAIKTEDIMKNHNDSSLIDKIHDINKRLKEDPGNAALLLAKEKIHSLLKERSHQNQKLENNLKTALNKQLTPYHKFKEQ